MRQDTAIVVEKRSSVIYFFRQLRVREIKIPYDCTNYPLSGCSYRTKNLTTNSLQRSLILKYPIPLMVLQKSFATLRSTLLLQHSYCKLITIL